MDAEATKPVPPASGPEARLRGTLALALALVTMLVYSPVRQFEFLSHDDDEYVEWNEQVKKGLTLEGFLWAFNVGHASNWHPLTWLSHMLDCQLFGLDAGAHHLVNVLLHALNTAVLFWVLAGMTGHVWRSGLVAALFAWHPLHVESVAWIAERKDVLSAFFGLWSLGFYARYGRTLERRWWWGALGLYGLGLASKPMLVTLPWVLLLVDLWPLGRLGPGPWQAGGLGWRLWRLAVEKWPFFALAAASCVITLAAQELALAAGEAFGWTMRAQNALVSYARYLGKMFWPVDLAVHYPYPDAIPWQAWGGAGVLLAGVTLLVWKASVRRPWLATGWFWFLGMLVPVIGLVQVGVQSMADRYTYLSGTGVFIIVVWGAAELCGRTPWRRVLGGGAAALTLAACVLLTSRQLQHWRNSVTLFEHALRVTPDNPRTRSWLQLAYARMGRPEAAYEQYLRAAELEAVQRNPNRAGAYSELGDQFFRERHLTAAVRFYSEALRHDPESADVLWNMGACLIALGSHDRAFDLLKKAAALKHSDARAQLSLGLELIRFNRGGEAVAWLEAAVRLEPDWTEPMLALAWVLATHPDPHVRNGGRAWQLAARVCELTGYQALQPLDACAAALAETGQFEQAAELAARAAALARQAGHDKLAAEIEARLAGYRRHEPHRDARLAEPITSHSQRSP